MSLPMPTSLAIGLRQTLSPIGRIVRCNFLTEVSLRLSPCRRTEETRQRERDHLYWYTKLV